MQLFFLSSLLFSLQDIIPLKKEFTGPGETNFVGHKLGSPSHFLEPAAVKAVTEANGGYPSNTPGIRLRIKLQDESTTLG